jgi:hypothetical protein
VIQDEVIRGRRYVGDTLLLGLLVQEPDVVFSRFALLRSHVRSLRKTPTGRRWTGGAQSMVNFPYRTIPGRDFFVGLNRSFILFVKASSTVPI